MRSRKEASKDAIMHFGSAYKEDIFDGIGDKSRLPLSGRYATFDNVDDYISAPHLIGTETVVSVGGTVDVSNIVISAGRIDVYDTSKIWDLVLSDGTHYSFSEGKGLAVYDLSGSQKHGLLLNVTPASFWVTDDAEGNGSSHLNSLGYSSGATFNATSTTTDYNEVIGVPASPSEFILRCVSRSDVFTRYQTLFAYNSNHTTDNKYYGFELRRQPTGGTNPAAYQLLWATSTFSIGVLTIPIIKPKEDLVDIVVSFDLTTSRVRMWVNKQFVGQSAAGQTFNTSTGTQGGYTLIGGKKSDKYGIQTPATVGAVVGGTNGEIYSCEVAPYTEEDLIIATTTNNWMHGSLDHFRWSGKLNSSGHIVDSFNQGWTISSTSNNLPDAPLVPNKGISMVPTYTGQVHYPIKVKEHFLTMNGVDQYGTLPPIGNLISSEGPLFIGVMFKTGSDITNYNPVAGQLSGAFQGTYGIGFYVKSGNLTFHANRNNVGFKQSIPVSANTTYFAFINLKQVPQKTAAGVSLVDDVKWGLIESPTLATAQAIYNYAYPNALTGAIGNAAGRYYANYQYYFYVHISGFLDDDVIKGFSNHSNIFKQNVTAFIPLTTGVGNTYYDIVTGNAYIIAKYAASCWDNYQYEFSNNHRGYNSGSGNLYDIQDESTIYSSATTTNYIEWGTNRLTDTITIKRSGTASQSINFNIADSFNLVHGETYKLVSELEIFTSGNIYFALSDRLPPDANYIQTIASPYTVGTILIDQTFVYDEAYPYFTIGAIQGGTRYADAIIHYVTLEAISSPMAMKVSSKIPASLANHHKDVLGNLLANPTLNGKYISPFADVVLNPYNAPEVHNIFMENLGEANDSNTLKSGKELYHLVPLTRMNALGYKYSNFELSTIPDRMFTFKINTQASGVVTDLTSFTLPIGGYQANYDFTVYWGDGKFDRIVTGDYTNATHVYDTAGEYTVRIDGTVKAFNFTDTSLGNTEDKLKLTDIIFWGQVDLGPGRTAHFKSCTNLIFGGYDQLQVGTMNLTDTFYGCVNLEAIPGIGTWDLSNAGALTQTFYNCIKLKVDVSNWREIKPASVTRVFYNCYEFNSDINFSGVVSYNSVFYGCKKFNGSINGADFSTTTSLLNMFQNCISFNRPINIDIPICTKIDGFLSGCVAFNSEITLNNSGAITSAANWMYNCKAFNHPSISSIDFSGVTNISGAYNLMQSLTYKVPVCNGPLALATTVFRTSTQTVTGAQDFLGWRWDSVTSATNLVESPLYLTTANYDLLLQEIATFTLISGTNFEFGNSKFTIGSPAEAARNSILAQGCTIEDGGGI